jgi:hypothetical protein
MCDGADVTDTARCALQDTGDLEHTRRECDGFMLTSTSGYLQCPLRRETSGKLGRPHHVIGLKHSVRRSCAGNYLGTVGF